MFETSPPTWLIGYREKVGTAGLDLVLDVGHLAAALHPAVLGVAQVAGGVDAAVQLVQGEAAEGRGLGGLRGFAGGGGGGGAEVGREDPQQGVPVRTPALSHLMGNREVHSETGKYTLKQEVHSDTGKHTLKQEVHSETG